LSCGHRGLDGELARLQDKSSTFEEKAMADLDILINNFRLLELAGAAEQIAHQGEESPEALLWLAYAEAARNYHSWISVGDFDNYALLAISDPGAGAGGGREFFEAIISEIALWTPELSFRGSYLHFLGAFEAMASLDGERMVRELKAVVERLDPREERMSLDKVRWYFTALDSPPLIGEVITSNHTVDEVLTLYQAMQVVADELGLALSLENHAFEDIRLFALRPGFAVSRTEPPN
jgi:hypothetical protein